jgi:hypothetical protein
LTSGAGRCGSAVQCISTNRELDTSGTIFLKIEISMFVYNRAMN